MEDGPEQVNAIIVGCTQGVAVSNRYGSENERKWDLGVSGLGRLKTKFYRGRGRKERW